MKNEQNQNAARLFKSVSEKCPACGLSGAHFCTRGMPLIDCPECGAHGPHVCITGGFVPGVSSHSPASSPVPSPLVPEVVKKAVGTNEEDGCAVCGTLSAPKNGICQYCHNSYYVIKAEPAKTAHEGSVCEGEQSQETESAPEVSRDAGKSFSEVFCHFNSLRLIGTDQHVFIDLRKLGNAMLYREQVESLVSYLTAWLHAGSFDLKGLPSSPPSSEDTELLDWLEDDPEYWSLSRTWKDGRIIRLETGTTRYFEAVREAVRAAKASTTTQKGGQGV